MAAAVRRIEADRPLIPPTITSVPTRGNGVNTHDAAVIGGLTARPRPVSSRAARPARGDAHGMLRNPVIVCLTLAVIVVVAAVAEAVVIVTTRRRRIAW